LQASSLPAASDQQQSKKEPLPKHYSQISLLGRLVVLSMAQAPKKAGQILQSWHIEEVTPAACEGGQSARQGSSHLVTL